MAEDTIAAIATPAGSGGIGIVRISGKDAVNVAKKCFASKTGKLLEKMPTYTAAYGYALDNGNEIDECIATVFRGPKSYTGEDVVELSCHGGIYIIKKVLNAVIKSGARLAQPGEFTKRAFLNGRIDLTQAESVMEVINARNGLALEAAVKLQEGTLYKEMLKIRGALTDLSADITAWVDFPDEDVPALERDELIKSLDLINVALEKYLAGYENGDIIREGIETAIVGKTNAGKSTIMNCLSGKEKSIVTEIPGTTRDIVESIINTGNAVLKIADTAGLRETDEIVEKIGVEKTKEKIGAAKLILAVFDGSRKLDEDDKKLISMVKEKNTIAVINKIDLPQKIEKSKLESVFKNIISVSAKKSQGIEKLKEKIENVVKPVGSDLNDMLLANERQFECVLRAQKAVKAAREAEISGITLDAVSVMIDEALNALFELTGEKASQNVIDRVFEKFCVGK